MALPLHEGEDTTIEEARQALVSKIGENMNVRRFVRAQAGAIYSYSHGVRIGVIIDMSGGDEALGRDLAMHIAASNRYASARPGACRPAGQGARDHRGAGA